MLFFLIIIIFGIPFITLISYLFKDDVNYLYDNNLHPKDKGKKKYKITFTMTHHSCNEDGSNMEMFKTDEQYQNLRADNIEQAKEKFCFHKQRDIRGWDPPSNFTVVNIEEIKL